MKIHSLVCQLSKVSLVMITMQYSLNEDRVYSAKPVFPSRILPEQTPLPPSPPSNPSTNLADTTYVTTYSNSNDDIPPPNRAKTGNGKSMVKKAGAGATAVANKRKREVRHLDCRMRETSGTAS